MTTFHLYSTKQLPMGKTACRRVITKSLKGRCTDAAVLEPIYKWTGIKPLKPQPSPASCRKCPIPSWEHTAHISSSERSFWFPKRKLYMIDWHMIRKVSWECYRLARCTLLNKMGRSDRYLTRRFSGYLQSGSKLVAVGSSSEPQSALKGNQKKRSTLRTVTK